MSVRYIIYFLSCFGIGIWAILICMRCFEIFLFFACSLESFRFLGDLSWWRHIWIWRPIFFKTKYRFFFGTNIIHIYDFNILAFFFFPSLLSVVFKYTKIHNSKAIMLKRKLLQSWTGSPHGTAKYSIWVIMLRLMIFCTTNYVYFALHRLF